MPVVNELDNGSVGTEASNPLKGGGTTRSAYNAEQFLL